MNIQINKSKLIYIIFSILLVADLSYSFLQYYNTPLYGDLEGGIVPAADVQQVLDDPLGFKAISTQEKHVNPNRFFAHYFFMQYFKTAPIFLQHFVSPISSVYLSCAIIKITIQFLTIYLLSFFITGERNILKRKFLNAAILITPLFQAYGYASRMGINDKSTAYTFFYAVPIILLILFLSPFFRLIIQNNSQRISPLKILLILPLIIILPLSGPLNPGVIVIATSLIFIYYLTKTIQEKKNCNKKFISCFLKLIPTQFLLMLIPVSLLSLYSIYLGTYDSNHVSASIPVWERYYRLPTGILEYVSHALGVPLLLILIGTNMYLINKHLHEKGVLLLRFSKWLGVFAMVYILLLPLGGYRPYRPYIIRYDTIMPVTICLIYIFGSTTHFLIQNFDKKYRPKYLIAIIIPLLIFTIVDTSGLNENDCERKALELIAHSDDKIVRIPSGCNVLSWSEIKDYRDSELKAELLLQWRVTSKKKLFYQSGN